MLEENLNPLSEIEAMTAIATALTKLDENSRKRVIHWASDIFSIQIGNPVTSKTQAVNVSSSQIFSSVEDSSEDLPIFYDKAHPQTDSEKTLVVSYWIQFKENQDSVDAQNVNTQLKHLGYGIGNITRAFNNLMTAKPSLIVQTRKSGTSKQARKTYKVTAEGKKLIESMLKGPELQ